MKTFLKVLLAIFLVLTLLIAGVLSYVRFALPKTGEAPNIKIELTPARVARGEYLANNVALCFSCHGKRDFTKYSGPVIPSTAGAGGGTFDQHLGFPGAYYARNISPKTIGNWTDGEIYRSLTQGITKQGDALFPIMPYSYFSKMSEEDVNSIIAYLRTLKPTDGDDRVSSSDFPMSLIINLMPREINHQNIPAKSDKVSYGKYMTNAGLCNACHTPTDEKGAPIAGMEFAGGFNFILPDGSISRSSNITPDDETGIGVWTKEMFVKRFKVYQDSAYASPVISKGQFNTDMPWTDYSGMKTEDLEAIYDYLRTLNPVKNKVVTFEAVEEV